MTFLENEFFEFSNKEANSSLSKLSHQFVNEGLILPSNANESRVDEVQILSDGGSVSVCNESQGESVRDQSVSDETLLYKEGQQSDNSRQLDEGQTSDSQMESEGDFDDENVEGTSVRVRKPPLWLQDYVTYFVSGYQDQGEPATFVEAMNSSERKEWQAAIERELQAFNENEAWVVVDKPKDKRIVGCRWVFKKKKDSNGDVNCYRARLVARGYTQTKGVDYQETFAPVVKLSCLRMLFSMSARLDLEIDHIDVCTAFLNGSLNEEIFMRVPEGFSGNFKSDKVCLLKKAVYGLKQSARMWNEKATEVFLRLGYKQSDYEHCIFYKSSSNGVVFVAVFVDDFLFFIMIRKRLFS